MAFGVVGGVSLLMHWRDLALKIVLVTLKGVSVSACRVLLFIYNSGFY